ncbi:MAG: hypothetical protein WC548_01935 [Candidatus Pacearchaeota archaeon]
MKLPSIKFAKTIGSHIEKQIKDSFGSVPCEFNHIPNGHLNAPKSPSAIFVDGKNLDMMANIRKQSPDTQLIAVYENAPYESLVEAYEKGLINQSVRKQNGQLDESQLAKVVDHIRASSSFYSDLSIGIIGYKTLGPSTAQRIIGNPHIENVRIYSDFHRRGKVEGYDELRAIDLDVKGEPVYCHSIEDVLEPSDIVIVSRGDPRVDYNAHKRNGRNHPETVKDEFDNVAPIVMPVIEIAKSVKFNGAFMVETNPGAILDLFYYSGFPRTSILQVQNDTLRFKNYLAQEVKELRNSMVREIFGGRRLRPHSSDFENVFIIGPHENPSGVLFDQITLYNQPLLELIPALKDSDLQTIIMENFRRIPPRIMASSQTIGFPYPGTPSQIADTIYRIAHFQELPNALTVFVDRYGTFLDWQGEIRYEQKGEKHVIRANTSTNFRPRIPKNINEQLATEAEQRKELILSSQKVPRRIKQKIRKDCEVCS